VFIATQSIARILIDPVLTGESLVDNNTADLDNSSKQQSMHGLIARLIGSPLAA
jgi:hypothetical protein